MVAAEKPRAVGTLQLLPAGEGFTAIAPDVDPFGHDEMAPAAMAEKAKGDKITKASDGDAAVKKIANLAAEAIGGKFKSGSTPRKGDPDLAYAFKVMIDKDVYGMFTEVGGLSWKAEAIPIRSGGNNEHGYHMRGPGKFEPLTLKRGWFAANGEFFDMLKNSLSGTSLPGGTGGKRLNITISVLNRKYEAIGEYQLKNAFIVEYSGLQLNSMGSQVGFEQIRMAYDYFEYKSK